MNQEANPFRSRGFHFVNTPPGFDVVFGLFKSLTNSTNQNELMDFFIHPNTTETLLDHISRDVLPEEYGGDSGTLESIGQHWEEKLISYRDYFIEEEKEKYGSDESKRENRLHNSDIFLETAGSINQLGFD